MNLWWNRRPSRSGSLFWAVTFGLLCGPPAWSQEADTETTDAQLCLDYDFYGNPKERLTTSLDLGDRQVLSNNQLIGEWLRVHLRGGLAWEAKRWLSLEGGIGGFYTYESDEEIEDTIEIRRGREPRSIGRPSTLGAGSP